MRYLSVTEKNPNRLAAVVVAIFALVAGPAWSGVANAQDFEPDHRLALYVDDNDPGQMQSALDIAANVSKHYNSLGELVEIRIIAFNQGLHMLRADTSPVLDRLSAFQAGMPNVKLIACGNTLDTMTRLEGERPPLVAGAQIVQTGIAELMDLAEAGWVIVRP